MVSSRVAIALLAACGPHLELRGAPTAIAAPSVADSGVMLPLPPIGETREAALADGWPVWVVHHLDDRASVISAVGPPRSRSAATLFEGGAAVVHWLAGTRRLLAGDILYDELGHVLGYAAADSCFDDCPRIEGPAFEEPDLATFAAVIVADDRIAVGDIEDRPPPPTSLIVVDPDRGVHVEHDLELEPALMQPVATVAVADAAVRPLGSYAMVEGSIVRSTVDAPRLCADRPRCASCASSSAALFGIAPVSINQPAVHAESGTILVRRVPQGLAVVAMTRSGTCNGM
jgi:hypothetical protein